MFTIAICDDNEKYIMQIKNEINEYISLHKILIKINTFSDPTILQAEVLTDINQFDLYIIDIEMPLINGFSLISLIKEKSPEKDIIIITSHMKYVLEGYTYQILRYIPRENMRRRLFEALDVAYNHCISTNHIIISHYGSVSKILCSDIAYIEKEKKYCLIYLVSYEDPIHLRKSLKELYFDLNGEEFIYINKGIIVNLANIIDIQNNSVTVSTNKQKVNLHISRNFQQNFNYHINTYWSKRL